MPALPSSTTPEFRDTAAKPAFSRFIGELLHGIRQQSHVPLLPEQNAVRRLSIAPRAPRFLVILLNRFGMDK